MAMAMGMGAALSLPPRFAVGRTCPFIPIPAAGGQEFLFPQFQSGSHALHLEPHGVSERVWSSAVHSLHRGRRRELPVIQQSRCSSAQRLDSATSRSPSVLDAEAAAAGMDFSTSRSPFLGEAKSSDAGMCFTVLGGLGLLACGLQFPEASEATIAVRESSFPAVVTFAGPEPSNALSLPTWVIHVASVVEWVTAMALVWKYGDTDGKSAWKGLTWGMVPLLGGAMCACTWHFFYNAESLEVLVVIQAFLTVVGNFTMWAAAYRIWRSSQGKTTVD